MLTGRNERIIRVKTITERRTENRSVNGFGDDLTKYAGVERQYKVHVVAEKWR